MKMVGGTGIIGQDMIVGFGNGKYKTFEGTEIVAENCVKAKVKDLVVEGKTIQDIEDLNNIESMAEKERNLANYIINAIGSLGKKVVFDNKNCLKITSTFSKTIVLDDTSNYQIYVSAYANNENNIAYSIGNFGGAYIGCGNKTWEVLKITKSLNKFSIYNYQNSEVYINLDTLSLVRVNNPYPLKLKINNNVTTLNLPIPLRSLPNGVCDTVEGNKLIQRVEKVVLDENTEFNFPTSLIMANTVLIGLTISSIPKVYDSTISAICDKLQFKNIYNLDESGFFIDKTGTKLWLRLSISIYGSTLKEIKTNLALNPITIYYPLATPIIHNLEIPSISTTKGTNVITTTNNIKPNLKIKVKVK